MSVSKPSSKDELIAHDMKRLHGLGYGWLLQLRNFVHDHLDPEWMCYSSQGNRI